MFLISSPATKWKPPQLFKPSQKFRQKPTFRRRGVSFHSPTSVGDVVHFDQVVRLRGSVKVAGFTSGRAITPSADDVAVLLMSMSGATEQAYRKAFDRLIKMTDAQKKQFRASEHNRFAAIKAIKQSAPKAAGSVRLSVAAELKGGAK